MHNAHAEKILLGYEQYTEDSQAGAVSSSCPAFR